MEMDWVSVAPLIAAGASLLAAFLAAQTTKQAIALNASVTKDQKDREHRLTHRKELAKKRLNIFDEFAALVTTAIESLADSESLINTPRKMDEFRLQWLGKKVYYYWLSQASKSKYDAISTGFARVDEAYTQACETDAGARFASVFTEQFGSLYSDLQDFMNQMGHDYEFLPEDDLKSAL